MIFKIGYDPFFILKIIIICTVRRCGSIFLSDKSTVCLSINFPLLSYIELPMPTSTMEARMTRMPTTNVLKVRAETPFHSFR